METRPLWIVHRGTAGAYLLGSFFLSENERCSNTVGSRIGTGEVNKVDEGFGAGVPMDVKFAAMCTCCTNRKNEAGDVVRF